MIFWMYTHGMTQRGRPATGKTPHRTIRIPDHVWKPAQEIAAGRGETITEVIERALRNYIGRHKHEPGAKLPKRPDHD
jgi:hypothetical protein